MMSLHIRIKRLRHRHTLRLRICAYHGVYNSLWASWMPKVFANKNDLKHSDTDELNKNSHITLSSLEPPIDQLSSKLKMPK